jgi:hypothetical protein
MRVFAKSFSADKLLLLLADASFTWQNKEWMKGLLCFLMIRQCLS